MFILRRGRAQQRSPISILSQCPHKCRRTVVFSPSPLCGGISYYEEVFLLKKKQTATPPKNGIRIAEIDACEGVLNCGAKLAAYEARIENLHDGYKVYSYPTTSAVYQALTAQGVRGLVGTPMPVGKGQHRGYVYLPDFKHSTRAMKTYEGMFSPYLFQNAGGVRFPIWQSEEIELIQRIGDIVDAVMRGEGNDGTAGTAI